MSAIETAFEVISESLDEAEEKVKADVKANEKEIENLLEDAKSEMDGLKLHINASPPSSKADYLNRLKALQSQYKQLERKLLVGDTDVAAKSKSESQSQQDSLARLKAAHQQLVEAEEVGTDTLVNLQQQRETLERTRDNLKETNQELGVSNNFVNRMSKWWRG